MAQPSSCGAMVLAGGSSSRLGADKGLVRVDGLPLVAWLPARLGELFSPVLLVVDRPNRYAVPIRQVVDAAPGAGPLAGLAAGLAGLATPAAFACACDMPLLRPALLARLGAAIEGHDLAIPQRAGRLEPLCAVYAAACLPMMQRLLADGRLRAGGIAAEVRTRVLAEAEWRDVDPDGDSFLSINTPADLTMIQERARAYGLTISAAAHTA